MQSRSALQFLFWEGAFAMAYETWIGPTYLSGVAGELGVSVAWVSVLAAIPAIGATGQLASLWFYQRASSVKSYVVQLAGISRALWAIPVLLAWLWGSIAFLRGGRFPADRWFAVAALCSGVASLVGSSSGVAWMAWVRELVPRTFRGRFFGVRQRYTMAAIVLAHAMGFLLVGWKPRGFHVGYGLLLLFGLICAALSTRLLSEVPDAPAARMEAGFRDPSEWGAALAEPFHNERFRSLLFFGALFNGTIQLAGPYFPYFFTRQLHLPMSTISLWTVLTNLGWFASSAAWGRRADGARKFGAPFWIAIHMIALSPAFYIFGSERWVQLIGPFDYFTNGVFWAGYNLVLTTLLLEACPAGQCALYYSVFSACNGLAGACGSLLGGQLALLLQPAGGFRALWALAACARLGVIWGLHRLLIRGAAEAPLVRPSGHIRASARPSVSAS